MRNFYYLAIAAVLMLSTGGAIAGAPNTVQLLGKDGVVGKSVPILVVNTTNKDIVLDKKIVVEKLEGTKWKAIDTSGLYLRKDCKPAPKATNISTFYTEPLTIKRHTTFKSAPWFGVTGDAQCACDECGPVAAGTYRYRTKLFGTGNYVHGEPFKLKASQ